MRTYALPALLGCLLLVQHSPTALDAQPPKHRTEPVLAGPSESLTVTAEEGIIVYVGGKWLRVDAEAVRKTQVTVRYDLQAKPEDLSVLVERFVQGDNGEFTKQLGQAEHVPSAAGVEFRVTVPANGTWFVTVVDYAARRTYPKTVVVGKVPKPDDPDDDDDEDDDPTPPAPPVVPDDAFDNIGQRVAKWGEGLTKRAEVAANYRKWAGVLRDDPAQTINTASQSMVDARSTILGSDNSYQDFLGKLNADFQERWPMARGLVADYWDAVAVGLEGAK